MAQSTLMDSFLVVVLFHMISQFTHVEKLLRAETTDHYTLFMNFLNMSFQSLLQRKFFSAQTAFEIHFDLSSFDFSLFDFSEFFVLLCYVTAVW